MVSTVWSVYCLLFFYSRCPPPAQPFVKVGARPRALWSRHRCTQLFFLHKTKTQGTSVLSSYNIPWNITKSISLPAGHCFNMWVFFNINITFNRYICASLYLYTALRSLNFLTRAFVMCEINWFWFGLIWRAANAKRAQARLAANYSFREAPNR